MIVHSSYSKRDHKGVHFNEPWHIYSNYFCPKILSILAISKCVLIDPAWLNGDCHLFLGKLQKNHFMIMFLRPWRRIMMNLLHWTLIFPALDISLLATLRRCCHIVNIWLHSGISPHLHFYLRSMVYGKCEEPLPSIWGRWW